MLRATSLPPNVGHMPELVALMTAEDRRSEGIGKILLTEIEGASGHRRYMVRTHDSAHHPTVRFYRRENFAAAGRLFANGEHFLVMVKEISA
jgi:hypothetical protein